MESVSSLMAARVRNLCAKEFVTLNIMSDLMAAVRRRVRLCHRCICDILKSGTTEVAWRRRLSVLFLQKAEFRKVCFLFGIGNVSVPS